MMHDAVETEFTRTHLHCTVIFLKFKIFELKFEFRYNFLYFVFLNPQRTYSYHHGVAPFGQHESIQISPTT